MRNPPSLIFAKIPPIWPSATAPVSIKDAEALAMKNIKGIEKVSYRNLEPQSAVDITASITAAEAKYGALGINEIKTYRNVKSGNLMSATIDANQNRTLRINTAKLGDVSTLDATLSRNVATDWAVSRNIKELTDHEVGHFLQYKGMTFKDAIAQDKDLGRFKAFGDGISRYGQTHGSEGLSEAFVLVTRGDSVGPLVTKGLKVFMGVEL